MPVWAEYLILVAAVFTLVALGADVVREGRRRRREREHLKKLRNEEAVEDRDALRHPGRLERRLLAAGLPIGPTSFLAVLALLALLVLDGVLALLPAVPLAAIFAAGLTVYIPWAAVDSLAGWRSRHFEKKLAEALGVMVGSLQAGENPTQAFSSVAETSPGVIREEFQEVAHRLALGMDVRRALTRIVELYDSEGVRLFTQALIAKWEVGGDLVPIVQSVSRVVRERLKVRLHIHTQLAASRVSAVLIALFPYIIIPFYLSLRPESLDRLVGHPLGPNLLTLAVLLQIVGFFWLRRILRIEL